MAYVVTARCIGNMDRSCVEVCPADCIHETDHMVVIDPDTCIDCAACEVACPYRAIVPASALRPDEQGFVRVNAAWREGPRAVEAMVAGYLAALPDP